MTIRPAIAVVLFAASVGLGSASPGLDRVRAEISRLEGELSALGRQERGVLGELDRLRAQLKLREAEHEEVSLRLDELNARIERHDRKIESLDEAQRVRGRYLSQRLREIYKAGRHQWLEQILDPRSELNWRGVGYAEYLSDRDAKVLREFRADRDQVDEERAALEQARIELDEAVQSLEERRANLDDARRRHQRRLNSLQRDRTERRAALNELREAERELTTLVETLDPAPRPPVSDVRMQRGSLERPANGPVSAGFGTRIHPRFRTEVPHPGWDIDAPIGSSIRAVFDGRVVYADWMRGYGLTVIVDHGHEVLSIYAHASVLLVAQGDGVTRAQTIGKVGDTGSLRGPYLYFEMRVGGDPVDPGAWLRAP